MMNTGIRIETDQQHISEEGRHIDTVFIRDGLHHKVRRVSDISIGPHKDGAAGNGGKHFFRQRSKRG